MLLEEAARTIPIEATPTVIVSSFASLEKGLGSKCRDSLEIPSSPLYFPFHFLYTQQKQK